MKKILITIPILSVFLSVLLLFSSFSVKANDVVFPAFPEPVEGQSSTHYFIIYQPEYNEYKLFKPLDPNNVYVIKGSDSDTFHFGGSALIYKWKEGETAWRYYLDADNETYSTMYHDRDIVLYSSFDVYYTDGTIFFQRAPIRESFLAQVKKVRMGAVMETVAKMVPVVMIAVAGFLGFRKAFNLLLRAFQGA